MLFDIYIKTMAYQTLDRNNLSTFIRERILASMAECVAVAQAHGGDVYGDYHHYVYQPRKTDPLCSVPLINPDIWFIDRKMSRNDENFCSFIKALEKTELKLVRVDDRYQDDGGSHYPLTRQEYHLISHNTIITQVDIVLYIQSPHLYTLKTKTTRIHPSIVDEEFMHNTFAGNSNRSNPYRESVIQYITEGWLIYPGECASSKISDYARKLDQSKAFTVESLNKFCNDYCVENQAASSEVVLENSVAAETKVQLKKLIAARDKLNKSIKSLDQIISDMKSA